MSIYPLKSANLVTVIYVLEVIINMQKKIEGVEKDKKCIRGDMEVMERGIYKIDQGMAWMKEHIPQVIKTILLVLTYQLLVCFIYLTSVLIWIL